jgi:hypothetical protein
MGGDETPVEPSDEQREIRRRRYEEARAAGLSVVEARLFADSELDVGDLRRLVKRGCEPRLIARILF